MEIVVKCTIYISEKLLNNKEYLTNITQKLLYLQLSFKYPTCRSAF